MAVQKVRVKVVTRERMGDKKKQIELFFHLIRQASPLYTAVDGRALAVEELRERTE